MVHAGIEIQVIDCLDDLEGIGQSWNAVQRTCEHKHVFLDHRFVTAWWRGAGQDKSMHTLVLWSRGEVHGIVPLALTRGWEAFPTRGKNVRIAEDYQHLPSMRWRRFVPVRRLGFPLSFSSSNIRSHLILREANLRQIESVLSYCRTIRDRWDILSLDGIPKGSDQENLLSGAAPYFGLRRGQSRHERSFLRTSLPSSMEVFLERRSGSFRRGLRRSRRQSIERSAGLGDFHIREYRGDSIDEGMNKLFDLERQSWKTKHARKRELHLTLEDKHRRFHRSVAKAFAVADEAQVLVTEIGGRPANALYSLEREGTIACVLTYQAEELASRVSVAPLWEQFFEIAIERGLREVDFNGNNSYLARYADGHSEFSRLVFYNPAFYSSLLRATADGANHLAGLFSRK